MKGTWAMALGMVAARVVGHVAIRLAYGLPLEGEWLTLAANSCLIAAIAASLAWRWREERWRHATMWLAAVILLGVGQWAVTALTHGLAGTDTMFAAPFQALHWAVAAGIGWGCGLATEAYEARRA